MSGKIVCVRYFIFLVISECVSKCVSECVSYKHTFLWSVEVGVVEVGADHSGQDSADADASVVWVAVDNFRRALPARSVEFWTVNLVTLAALAASELQDYHGSERVVFQTLILYLFPQRMRQMRCLAEMLPVDLELFLLLGGKQHANGLVLGRKQHANGRVLELLLVRKQHANGLVLVRTQHVIRVPLDVLKASGLEEVVCARLLVLGNVAVTLPVAGVGQLSRVRVVVVNPPLLQLYLLVLERVALELVDAGAARVVREFHIVTDVMFGGVVFL